MVPHGVLYTQMFIKQCNRIAGSTLFAVEKIFSASDPADSALIAMILPLISVIIIKFAHLTKILPHIHATVDAHFIHRLLDVANQTNYPLDIIAAKLMAIIRGLVVAVTTMEDLITARRADFASPPVVFTPVLHFSKIEPRLAGGPHIPGVGLSCASTAARWSEK